MGVCTHLLAFTNTHERPMGVMENWVYENTSKFDRVGVM